MNMKIIIIPSRRLWLKKHHSDVLEAFHTDLFAAMERESQSEENLVLESERCRFCGLIRLSLDIYSEVGRNNQTSEKLDSVLGISITENDNLGTYICIYCLARLELSWKFKLNSLSFIEGTSEDSNETHPPSQASGSTAENGGRGIRNANRSTVCLDCGKWIPRNEVVEHEARIHFRRNFDCLICKAKFEAYSRYMDHPCASLRRLNPE